MRKLLSAVQLISLFSLFLSCGGGGAVGGGTSRPVLTSLQITPGNASIAAGLTEKFTATGSFSDGSTRDITTSVTWTSSHPAVASINFSGTLGLAKAVAAGSATITASSGGISGRAEDDRCLSRKHHHRARTPSTVHGDRHIHRRNYAGLDCNRNVELIQYQCAYDLQPGYRDDKRNRFLLANSRFVRNYRHDCRRCRTSSTRLSSGISIDSNRLRRRFAAVHCNGHFHGRHQSGLKRERNMELFRAVGCSNATPGIDADPNSRDSNDHCHQRGHFLIDSVDCYSIGSSIRYPHTQTRQHQSESRNQQLFRRRRRDAHSERRDQKLRLCRFMA
jgi:hypothetical protein